MNRGSRISALVLAVLLGLWFLLAGSQKFLSRAAFESMFADFGLPTGLVPVIGALELIAAVLVFIPRTALYGAALIAVIMVGAIFSHMSSGAGTPVAALVALVLSLIVAWLRFGELRGARSLG